MTSIEIKQLNLKQLRNIFGLKQAELAKYLNITKQGYKYKESGERTFKLQELIALSKLFDIDLDTLIIIIDKKQKNNFKIDVDIINKI